MSDLRVKMIEEMKLRRFAPRTQQAYTSAVAGLAKFYNQTPDKITTKQIKAYLLYLLDKRQFPLRQGEAARLHLRPCCHIRPSGQGDR